MVTTKQIFSISMVKNEMDIIESFVRYNINIVDGMIILDNGSTDLTLKILKNLKNEGLSLFIIEDEDNEYEQVNKMNMLLKKSIKEYEADIIVPLDADEFLISSNGGNPREILENVEPSTFYKVYWKSYVPNFSKNKQEKFIPAKITLARKDTANEMYKVILPKELVENYFVELIKGNHDLTYNQEYNDSIKGVFNSDLRLAHFPIRSKEQFMSKITVGWINNLCDVKRTENQSWHLQKMFNSLKETGIIENEDIINFAKEYSSNSDGKEIEIIEDPIDLTFCKNIVMKYTGNKINPIVDLLKNCESLSLAYLNYKKGTLTEIENLKKEKLAEEKKLKNKIKEYENSTSWIITSPLRKIGYKLKNLRN